MNFTKDCENISFLEIITELVILMVETVVQDLMEYGMIVLNVFVMLLKIVTIDFFIHSCVNCVIIDRQH